MTAADAQDRTWAIWSWLGLLVAGPVVAIAGWLVNREKSGSLTKRCAPVVVGIWLVTAIVYFPGVIWAYGFGGSKDVFWVAFGTVSTIYVLAAVVGAVASVRARLAATAGGGSLAH